MAAPAATTATPPFASQQRGGEGLFALKSLASARPARARQQRSLREPKPVLSAGKSKILAVGGEARGQWLFGGGREPRFQDSRGAPALAPSLARPAKAPLHLLQHHRPSSSGTASACCGAS